MTDYISRADVFEIIDKAFSQPMRNGVTLYADICLMLNALPTHANSRSTHERDLISRADAIKAVADLPNAYNGWSDTYDKACIIGVIEELPSADAVQGWIPVEEQPPMFPCLVCDANGNQPSVPLGIVTITDEEHGEWHIDGRLWDTKIFFKGEWCSQTGYGNRIIAWMPLPTPYKGGAE